MSLLVSRLTMATVVIWLATSLTPPATIFAQTATQQTDTTRGLRIQWADGRSTTTPLRPSGGMWTEIFPRIKDADTSRDGSPLIRIDVKYVVDGSDVAVTVSLLYGRTNRSDLKVAIVRVSSDTPVEVTALRDYGVEPIVLSLVAIPVAATFSPNVISASAQLVARAEPVGPNAAAYRLVISNQSPHGLMWFQFKAYRGAKPISGRPRGRRNLPLVQPNAEFIYELAAGTGFTPEGSEDSFQPVDRIEITSVMWQDGLVEGDPEPAEQQARFDSAKALQLRTVLTALRTSRDSLATLRSQIERVSSPDPEVQQFRAALLADLDALERTQRSTNDQDFDTWLARNIAECRQWLDRIVLPKS